MEVSSHVYIWEALNRSHMVSVSGNEDEHSVAITAIYCME
jgi:hypothetical protein